jgi:hypothetical protein
LHDALRRRWCVFAEKDHRGDREKRKGDPSSFVGSGPSSYCRNERRN